MSVYLDNAATTPVRAEVLTEYTKYLQLLGNPSSVHTSGQLVRQALEEARESLAKTIDCDRSEVLFTSGGTESTNLAIKGIYWQRSAENSKRNVIITAGTEHHGVIDPIEWLEAQQSAEIVLVPVNFDGEIDLDWLAEYLTADHERVALISLMWANNETGVITDINKVTALAKKYLIPVHTDAVAAFGHMPTSFKDSGLQAMSISAHKIGGPVGVGALIVSRSTKLVSIIHGGGQERGMRSGTMNAPAAKAFALAAEICIQNLHSEIQRTQLLSDRLVAEVSAITENISLTAAKANRLANITHFTLAGASGESLLFLLDQKGIFVSTGSACQAGVNRPSHVLIAMGRTEDQAKGCLRITFGHDNTEADVECVIQELPAAIESALSAGLSSQ
ncbi:MAG: cysteine desulfurase [Rhodoluna sp.]|nr:cysteine desulfurase [Rhodoluna sp.]